MCGICGVAFADPGRTLEPGVLDRMTDVLRHRGPDGAGAHEAPGIALGVRRLAIVDLMTGDQPIASEDGAIVVVCNGEIYNHVELRRELVARGHRFRSRSDVETIVHLYEEVGDEVVHRLRGMFAFALWDAPRRRLLLARDRLGIKPLVYAETEAGLAFASEAKALVAGDLIEPRLDARALADVLEYGFVLGDATFFEGVPRLPPGHRLVFEDGVARSEAWWRVRFPAPGERPALRPERWAAGLRERLEESVRLHLRSDVPVGSWLSGGLDSSAIAALAAAELDGERLETYSIAFDVAAYDETEDRALLSDLLPDRLTNRRRRCTAADLDLFPRAVWHYEGVDATGIEIPRWRMSELAAADRKVVLTGEGSDELLGGYWRYGVSRKLEPVMRLPRALRRAIVDATGARRRWPGAARVALYGDLEPAGRLAGLFGPDPPPWPLFSRSFVERVAEAGGVHDVPRPEGWSSWTAFEQQQWLDLTTRLPNHILDEIDRLSMAHSIEVRVPFLDPVLVEYAALIPPGVKMRWWTEKHVLRQAVRDVLPAEIANRPKKGLRAPIGPWMKGPVPDVVEEFLSERSVREKGYFDPDAVARSLRAHRAGEAEVGALLAVVLGIQLWDEAFVRGRPDDGRGEP